MRRSSNRCDRRRDQTHRRRGHQARRGGSHHWRSGPGLGEPLSCQAVRLGDWKVHLPRREEQLPFWDKAKQFRRLKQPVLYNLRDDQGESRDLAQANPELVQRALRLADAMRKELGEYMQRGKAQRPTGSVHPEAPVISHEKDWGQVPPAVVKTLNAERSKRHPGWKAKTKTK